MLFTGRQYDTLPSHIESASPVYKAISTRISDRNSSLNGYALAVTDSLHEFTKTPRVPWNGDVSRFDEPPAEHEAEEYGAVVYPDRLEVPFGVSSESLESGQLERFCASLPQCSISSNDAESQLKMSAGSVANANIDLFVCTHGKRDCRCGDVGASLYEALCREARRRNVGHAAQGFKEGSGPIRIHRTTQ